MSSRWFSEYVSRFRRSARLFKSGALRPLVISAMLLALQVVLGFFSISIGEYIRISFGYIALAAAGAILGPVAAPVNGALADILGFLIKPTGPYFPGFTITGLVNGLIYGVMFYQDEVSLKRILVTKLVADVVCNLILNTLWVNMLYGKAFFVLLPPRLIKNLAQYPIDVLILWPLMRRVIMPARNRLFIPT